MSKLDDDHKLREVKAILDRLQRVPPRAEAAKNEEEALAVLRPVAPVVQTPANMTEEARAAHLELVTAVSGKEAKKGGPRIVSNSPRTGAERDDGIPKSLPDGSSAATAGSRLGPEVHGPAVRGSGGRRGKTMVLVSIVGMIAAGGAAITLSTVEFAAIVRLLGPPGESQPARPADPGAAKPTDPPHLAALPPETMTPQTAKSDPLPETLHAKIPSASDAGHSSRPPTLDELLREAQRRMAVGEVVDARVMLEKAAGQESADVAFALARSYDPNFLKSLPSADADADVSEAERWYRRWHEIAVKNGLVTDRVKLERLIGSMR